MFLFKCVLKLLINFALFFLLLLVYICVGVEIVTLMQDCNTYMTVIYMQFSGLYDHYWMICLYKINLCGNIPVKQQELRFRVVRFQKLAKDFSIVIKRTTKRFSRLVSEESRGPEILQFDMLSSSRLSSVAMHCTIPVLV